MKVQLEAFGFKFDQGQDRAKDRALDLSIEEGTPLSGLLALLDAKLHLDTSDKTVLVNGAYVSPTHRLQEGDRVQILRMLNGG